MVGANQLVRSDEKPNMRVLYDHQIFCRQRFGGISRYFTSLMSHLSEAGMASPILPFRWTQNHHLLETGFAHVHELLPGIEFRGKRRLLNFLDQRMVTAALAEGNYDLFHPTYFDDYYLPIPRGRKFILTVHDMAIERLPDYFPNEGGERRRKKALAEAAAMIITVSEHTRQDLISLSGIEPEKVVTIHLGSPALNTEANSSIPLPDRYVLFVGERYAYKNFSRFARAMAGVMQRDPSLHLFCVGGAAPQGLLDASLEKAQAEGRAHWKRVDDATLAQLYRKAAAFVFPSLYEGFGIPILEAFRMGCPAVLSNASCLPEIAGDAAEYFDPFDCAAIAQAIERVLRDDQRATALREKGFSRERDFSWYNMAEKTAQVYRKVL